MLKKVHLPVEMESWVRKAATKSQYRTHPDTKLNTKEIYFRGGASSYRWRLPLDQADADSKQQP